MTSYLQLKTQIEKLQKEAESVKRRELSETITKIKKAIKAFGLTAEDLGFAYSPKKGRRGIKTDSAGSGISREKQKRLAKKTFKGREKATGVADRRSVVAPKFRDSATGAQWSGRGKRPKWLSSAIASGRKLEDFSI